MQMRKIALFIAGFLFLSSTARGQETPAAELSAGYSYFRAGGHNGANLNGASISMAGNVNSWFGVVGDYGFYHHQPSGGTALNLHTFTVGPRFSYRSSSRVTPFGQVLAGGFHGLTTNGFSLIVGGGLDVRVSDLIAIRPVQLEYVLLRAQGDSLNSGRVSAGIVFHFGKR
jgi:hypothetical protein